LSAHPSIDDVYAAFVKALPAELVGLASALPVVLQLAPSPDVPWSEVFSHEITLGAPRLVAEGMPGVSDEVVCDASLAHLLAIIEAFGTDRLLDGQIEPTPELESLLARARLTRDEALARVMAAGGDAGVEVPTYARADAETATAIGAEHDLLHGGETVAWARYLAVSYGKQRLGLPASLALARAAGWDARRGRTLARLLDAVWVGLQLHDDVLDWESDLARGGAWAVSLTKGAAGAASVRQVVFASGVLHRMLRQSARCFRAARRRAEALHLDRLAAWARERERYTTDVARREAQSPGQTNRAHALSNWAKIVLQG
jgi:hypothetical protein